MSRKALVVDNHPMMLKFMSQLLLEQGYRILTANNGLSALDILKTESPEVIFTDLIMPHIDGEKLCRIIRKIPRLKDVYVIVFSAIAAEQEVVFADFGANACIAKGPMNKMREHVLTALDHSERHVPVSLSDKTIGTEDVYPRHITKELLSIKRHFEVILDRMSEGILEINLESRVVYANPSAIDLIGIAEERLLAADFIDLFDPADRQRVKKLLTGDGSGPRVISDENPVRLNARQVSVSIFPIFNQDPSESIVILRDVTERKRMEAQLFQAQKMEAIGTLAGGVAHDFNNLLMVVQGNVSLMLLDVAPSHPHYEMLKMIEKKVQSGSRLTSQLLGYASKGRYEIKPISLNQLVEETLEAFERTRKSLTIHRDFSPGLFPVEADSGQIEQVLMNLLVNAGDAMPFGGDLFLKTANINHRDIRGKVYQPKPGNYVLLTVTDTGVGMDAKTLQRIFDPFFTTKEFGKGTGLGLALVYGIIKGHGGYIDVESDQGRGATFKIYLPASEKAVEKAGRLPDAILKGTETILVIDDEDLVLEVGRKFLQFMGYHVLTARNGKEALETYEAHQGKIDLVILDLVMPRMEGGEVFDKLKQISSGVKILISSGYGVNGEVSKLLGRGAKGFIQKPFDMKELSQVVRSLLNG